MNSKFIPLSVPNLKGNELKYVSDAIEKEWVSTAGEYVNKFEEKVAEYVNVTRAVSCQNGTSAIHTSLLCLGLTKEDEVLCPTLTFIASINPIKYIGAQPVFIDCDDSLCIDPKELERFCIEECDFIEGKLINRKSQKHVKILLIVHIFGNMANMEELMKVAKKYNLLVLEDAAEALGTKYTEGPLKGKFAGTIGDIGIYSFNGNKIITTGGGGMIVSSNLEYLDHAKHLTTQAKEDELYYIHDEVGYNYRLTNLQAALGVAQMEQLESFITIKNRFYDYYKTEIEKIDGLKVLNFRTDIRSNKWFFAVFVDEKFKYSRDEIIIKLKEKNIQSRPIWGLISDQKPYQDAEVFGIENSRHFIDHVVNIPCSTNLTQDEVEYVVQVLKSL